MGFFDQSGKAVKFQTIGDTVTGKVVSFREAQVQKYGTNDLDFWPDGQPKMQVIIVLETDEEEDGDDDGMRSLYIASTRQKRALLNALRLGGSKEPDEGGTLTMTYTGNDPKSKNPANPAKMYSAEWVKPTAKPFNAGLGHDAAAAKASVPAAVSTPVQSLPAAPDDRLASLISMGLDDATIAAALGVPAEQVAAARK